jgi:hypothetical protein
MPENTTAYRHVLIPIDDGPSLEWLRVQTGCRSLTKTLSLLIRIATTPEGLVFIKNHPLSLTHPWPSGRSTGLVGRPVPAPVGPGRSVRELMLGRDEDRFANAQAKYDADRFAKEQPFSDSEKVAIAIGARNIKDEN